jgi:hypothetical protein
MKVRKVGKNIRLEITVPGGGLECWAQRVLTIYRGQGFLAIVRFGYFPSPVSKLAWRHTGRLRTRGNLLTVEGGGARSQSHNEKAWSSINHSIFSGWAPHSVARSLQAFTAGFTSDSVGKVGIEGPRPS